MERLVGGAYPSVGKNYQAWGAVRLEKALFPKMLGRGLGKPTILVGAAKVIVALSLKSYHLGFDGSNMVGKDVIVVLDARITSTSHQQIQKGTSPVLTPH